MSAADDKSAQLRRWLAVAMCGFGVVAGVRAAQPPAGAAILQQLRSFNTTATVLYIAAHPDDENTQLITYLARGRGYRMAYLSITRGDGGQNEIGPEFGEKLGLARTYELLAARELDGGRQFFTRALDFGFTKDVKETLRIWDHQQVLSDVVRVIRSFRPDVVIAGMNPVQTPGQHGQHVASAVLAIEAFKVSGDPKAFPEHLADGLTPWRPTRIVQNIRFGRGGAAAGTFSIEAGGKDPVTGEGFGAIAARSRGMHKTQGFGGFAGRGGGGAESRQETFSVIDGEPATKDIVEGIDTSWTRFPGGAEVAGLTEAAISGFNLDHPAASIPAVLGIRAQLAKLPADPIVADKRAQLDRILIACLGLEVETTMQRAEITQNERFELQHSVKLQASVPVRWTALRFDHNASETAVGVMLPAGQPARRETVHTLPADASISQPYWLQEEPTPGMFCVTDTKLIGQPLNPPAFPVEYVFSVNGQSVTVTTVPVQIMPDAPAAQRRRPLTVISSVSLAFPYEVRLFAPGASKPVDVELTASRAAAGGTVRLTVPAGWKVSPLAQPFQLANPGDKMRVTFTVAAPDKAADATVTAVADLGGERVSTGRVVFRYPHLPVQLLQPPVRLKAVAFDLARRGQRVGYVPGAGDSVAESLEQMGYAVTLLGPGDVTAEKLQPLDAVVIGVRAFNERKDLATSAGELWRYVENGGTVVAQYNRPSGGLPALGPYPLSIQGSAPQLRVTDENAPVTLLAPDHPALKAPNRIGPEDFAGWVQERGAYFPSKWDDKYLPLLAMSDPGEAPLKSGVLLAQYGKGYYVYTGLAFFRQLPAGVPGAYRLFANLVSLGK